MKVTPEQLRARTKQFDVRIVRLCNELPRTDAARTLGRQLLRAGTSVAANYRAAGRGRSRAEFAAKMGTVVEEADEAVFWLELLIETGTLPQSRLESLLREANELLAIFSASHSTVRRGVARGKTQQSPDHPMTRL